MKNHNAVETIKEVSRLFETKNKFAFVTYTRSSVLSVLGEIDGEKKPPKSFSSSVLDGLQKKDPNFMKAIQSDLVLANQQKLEKIGAKVQKVYDPSFLEHYINNNIDIFKMFMSWYIKNTKSVVVSFQNESYINKYFSSNSIFINVPYNDFYSRVDSIVEEIGSKSSDAFICVLDCPMLSAALAPKIWDKINISILDLGRTFNVVKSAQKNSDAK